MFLIFTKKQQSNFFNEESYQLDLHFTFTTIDFFQNDEDLKRQATHQNKMFNPIKKEMLQKKIINIKKIRFRFKFNLRWWYKQLIMQSLIIRFIINLSIYVWIIERIHERVNVFWKYQFQCFPLFGIFSLGSESGYKNQQHIGIKMGEKLQHKTKNFQRCGFKIVIY